MATFEQRTDARGEVQAIRAKVRRVGQPHLSRTFRVQGSGAKALRAALSAARQWAALVEAGSGLQTPNRSHTASAFAEATGDAQGGVNWTISAADDADPQDRPAWLVAPPITEERVQRLLAETGDARQRALLQFVLETAQAPDVLARLRWQHVLLAERQLQVLSPAGDVLRVVPLSPPALQALLAMGGRKYGLVFGGDEQQLHANLAQLAAGLDADVPTLYRAAAWRMLNAGRSAGEISCAMGLHDLTPLRPPRPAASARTTQRV